LTHTVVVNNSLTYFVIFVFSARYMSSSVRPSVCPSVTQLKLRLWYFAVQ